MAWHFRPTSTEEWTLSKDGAREIVKFPSKQAAMDLAEREHLKAGAPMYVYNETGRLIEHWVCPEGIAAEWRKKG